MKIGKFIKILVNGVIPIFLILLMVSAKESDNKSDNIRLSFGVGGQAVGIETERASFSFFAPTFSIKANINTKFNLSFNYFSGSDKVLVGSNDFKMDWKQLNLSADYKLLNEDKSWWVSLLYRQFEMKSAWQNEVDKDRWEGIGIGVSYNPKLKENLYAKIGINYFPYLRAGIADYKNFEISGQLEYHLKNNKNSIVLNYTNQNITSLTSGIRNIKVNELGISLKTVI